MNESEPTVTGAVSNETAAAVFSLLREDIQNLRQDNKDRHTDIVHRLDTINGRVHRHDRELADIQGRMVTRKQLWAGAGTIVVTAATLFAWLYEQFHPALK